MNLLTCTDVQKKLNQAILQGGTSLTIEDEDISHKQLDDLIECGFLVEPKDREDGTQYFIVSK